MIRRAALLAPAALAGCTLAPAYHRPEAAIPAAWPSGPAYAAPGDPALPDYPWRSAFADPRLKHLIESALTHNQDLAVATAQIAAARAQAGIVRAELLPQLDATLLAHRANTGAAGPSGDTNAAELGVSGYEIDLFGRLRSLSGAARARYFASVSAARATRLTLIADLADAWIAYAAEASLRHTAEATAAAARESLRLTQARLAGGIAPRSDVRQAEIALSAAEADLAETETALAQDRNALRLLVGAEPAEADLPGAIDQTGGAVAEVPAGLDSAILLRRPDVFEAEWQLRAANAQIGAARAALFPKITLTALAGFISPALSALFDRGNFVASGGASATWPVFAGGAARQGVKLSEAQRDAALGQYRKAVQAAFADTANALARRGTIEAELAAVTRGRDAAADALHLADLRYKAGADSYLADLTARQALYTAEKKRIALLQVRAANRVALYRALGGDASLDESH